MPGHHKPIRMSPWRLEASESEEDAIWRLHPERALAVAHDTANLLVRGNPDSGDQATTLEKLNRFVEEEGIETLAELWAGAEPVSLPGALFRLYQIRDQITKRPDVIGDVVQRGVDSLQTIDPVVVGAQEPVTAGEVTGIIDRVLRGGFSGELGPALERAASLARVIAAGLLNWPQGDETNEHELALRSLAWDVVATDLANCARSEKVGRLR